MTTMRVALVFLVVGIAVLLTLWALGLVGGGDVAGATGRTVALVGIGAAASALVFALAGGNRGPGSGAGGNGQGPKF